MSKKPQPPEAPRYRIVAEIAFISGCEFRRGAETTSRAWPSRDMEPLNSSAERIKRFWAKHQAFPLFPISPVAGAHGFYLPAVLPKSTPPRKAYDVFNPPGCDLVSPVAAEDVTPLMPKYRLREFSFPETATHRQARAQGRRNFCLA